MSNDSALETLLDRIPPEVADTFTQAQRAALYAAINPVSWRRHPVNIRLSFPLLSRRYFVTVVCGHEMRSYERLSRERRMFPLRTIGNALFLAGLGGAFYMAAVVGIMALSSLIEF